MGRKSTKSYVEKFIPPKVSNIKINNNISFGKNTAYILDIDNTTVHTLDNFSTVCPISHPDMPRGFMQETKDGFAKVQNRGGLVNEEPISPTDSHNKFFAKA